MGTQVPEWMWTLSKWMLSALSLRTVHTSEDRDPETKLRRYRWQPSVKDRQLAGAQICLLRVGGAVCHQL